MTDPEGSGETVVRRPVTAVRILALRGERRLEMPEEVVTEEPLEVRAGGPGQAPEAVAITMRTPGHDFELAVGFLIGEGILDSAAGLDTVRYCQLAPGEAQHYNVVSVRARAPLAIGGHQRRHTVTAACGVCGLSSLEELERRCSALPGREPADPAGPAMVGASVLVSLPDALRRGQKVFERTGGLHAAGLFTPRGSALVIREDVGRHNAVDKLVGWAALAGRLPLAETLLTVSGRVSFEIVQKAAVAGVPVLVAVSAPSSLAVATAEGLGITLVGFVRDGRANIYSHPGRVDPDN